MYKKHIYALIAAMLAPQAYAEQSSITSPVVITATRTEQNSFDLPVSIDVVDAQTINDSRLMANLSEISPRIPGVVINNRYNSAQELAISSRGFGARWSLRIVSDSLRPRPACLSVAPILLAVVADFAAALFKAENSSAPSSPALASLAK